MTHQGAGLSSSVCYKLAGGATPMSQLKPADMPSAHPQRIICHWTAGAYKASPLDRKHYHFLIEDDGNIVRGIHGIADNDSTSDGKYAAHTLNCNTKSIGLSVCCMAGATSTNHGRFPMTEVQWRRMAEIAAELCKHYQIEVTPQTVLGHFEVESQLGIAQRGKWDPGLLPWEPDLKEREVGSRFRNLVQTYKEGAVGIDETPGADLALTVQGKSVGGGISVNEEPMVPVKSLVDNLGVKVPYASASHAVLEVGHGLAPIYLRIHFLEDGVSVDESAVEEQAVALVIEKGYIAVNAVAAELDLSADYDADTNTLKIGAKPGRGGKGALTNYRPVVVRRGDTLSRIAAIQLGNGDRWTQLMQENGKPFTQAEARRLQIGQVVLVPVFADDEPVPAPGTIVAAPSPDLKTTGVDLDLLVQAAQPAFQRFAMESIPVIFAECISSGVSMYAQIAYVLATAEHESGCGKWMRELWGPTAAQRGYEGRGDLGNTQAGDGLRFRGRGYVQITGRRNYTLWARRLGVNIVADPDLVATDPSMAAKILVQGMRDGSFTGKTLLDHISPGAEPDFFSARAIVNGDKRKNGEKIAGHADNYLAALTRPSNPD
jgi:N-acetyl-anhydromuramyl-L-alanine amidase AmpD